LSAAALHYHFGSKSVLMEALLLRHMPRLMERRAELLATLAKRTQPPSAREVLAAFIQPLYELLADSSLAGHRYIRFIARAYAEGDVDARFVLARFRDGLEPVAPLLQRAVPEVDPDLLSARFLIAIDSVLHALARDEFLPNTPALSSHWIDVLLDHHAGGLAAPVHAGASLSDLESFPLAKGA
jgi:AcrR family transcriptional regulator